MRRILVLYWYPPNERMRASVERHVRALDGFGDDVVYHNAFVTPPAWLARLPFDGVVLHNTFLGVRWDTDFAAYRRTFRWLTALDMPKIAVPQDEYDHSGVLDEWLAELGVSVVMSDFEPDLRSILYPTIADSVEFRKVLTGYVDNASARSVGSRLVPLESRPYDVVYRASRLPFWFGSHGQLKHKIGEVVAARAPAHDLSADISTQWQDRILGPAWFDFLGSGRVVIGCESGSSVLDRAGEIRRQIESILEAEPELSFEEVDERMPDGWDGWRFFAISPRHLEAVTTRTCQVLVEGDYSGVLEANRHYIPLAQDLSNVDEVLDRIKDAKLINEIVSCAYEEIYLSGLWAYETYAEQLHQELGEPPARSSLEAIARRAQFAAARGYEPVRTGLARVKETSRLKARSAGRRLVDAVRQ